MSPYDLHKEVIKVINKSSMITKGEHIVVGLSGGPDSLCLFFLLYNISKEYDLKLYPVHINHKFRPKDAEKDEAFVVNFCKEKGYECSVFTYDCNKIAKEKKITSEEAGRLVRYEAFAKVADRIFESGVKRNRISVAVGQNSDDLSETVLFRILRGVGTDGLKSIAPVRYDEYGNKIIRPLLDVSRVHIEEYCKENSLIPCIDKTNYEPIYSRNKIRLELLPLLEKDYNSNIKSALVRLSKTATIDSDYFHEQTKIAYDAAAKIENNMAILRCDILQNYHKAIVIRVIIKALGNLGLNDDLSFNILESCYNMIQSGAGTKKISLPHGFIFKKIYSEIKIYKDAVMKDIDPNEAITSKYTDSKDSPGDAYDLKLQVINVSEYRNIETRAEKKSNFHRVALDYDKIISEYPKCLKLLRIRHRCQGDFLFIASDKRKKIQDLFVDKKVPKDQRDAIPLLALRNTVLAVFFDAKNHRISEKFTIDSHTKRVLIVEFAIRL